MKLYHIISMLLLVGVLLVSGCVQQETANLGVPALGSEGVEEMVVDTTGEEAQEPAPAGEVKEFTMTAKNWEFTPSIITVNNGDTVKLHIKSVDITHGFKLSAFGINEDLEPGQTVDVEFVADKAGTFTFVCSVFCGPGHSKMDGQLIVK